MTKSFICASKESVLEVNDITFVDNSSRLKDAILLIFKPLLIKNEIFNIFLS